MSWGDMVDEDIHRMTDPLYDAEVRRDIRRMWDDINSGEMERRLTAEQRRREMEIQRVERQTDYNTRIEQLEQQVKELKDKYEHS